MDIAITKKLFLAAALVLFVIFQSADAAVEIDILDFGVYERDNRQSIEDASAPTGKFFTGGSVVLLEKTNQIEGVLGRKFGMRLRVKDDLVEPVLLIVVFHFPKMEDPKNKGEFTSYKKKIEVTRSSPGVNMFWDFTEPWEIVPGKWLFQVYQGSDLIMEKWFTVLSATAQE